ncbi:hypothetical protein L1049_022238 [Liquidambar formosana]|uniref:ABC transmembrane type-1 domain-containing protein n=1 Tax=Liquidambar formosana TaxID=63359 RepID=A0AAP0RE00_LIQFO
MSQQGPFSGTGDGDDNVKMKQKEEKKTHKVSLLKLFAFAHFYDYVLMAIGSVSAMVHGASVPVFFIYFGKLINVLGLAYLFPAAASDRVAKYSLDFVYLSVAILFSSWMEVACWMHTGERQAAKMRMAYLRAMLNQDISLFDTESSTGEVISAITSDIIIVQDAISEKVGNFIHYISRFLLGFIIGFIRSQTLRLNYFSILRNEIGWFDDANNTSAMLSSRLESDGALLRTIAVDRSAILLLNVGFVVTSFIITFILNWRITLVVLATYPLVISGHINLDLYANIDLEFNGRRRCRRNPRWWPVLENIVYVREEWQSSLEKTPPLVSLSERKTFALEKKPWLLAVVGEKSSQIVVIGEEPSLVGDVISGNHRRVGEKVCGVVIIYVGEDPLLHACCYRKKIRRH